MHPDHYTAVHYQPKCPSCGARKWHADVWRQENEKGRKPMCLCSGYHFPHRKGSKFCHHNPSVEKHMEERYANT
jgi:hypothetical protein